MGMARVGAEMGWMTAHCPGVSSITSSSDGPFKVIAALLVCSSTPLWSKLICSVWTETFVVLRFSTFFLRVDSEYWPALSPHEHQWALAAHEYGTDSPVVFPWTIFSMLASNHSIPRTLQKTCCFWGAWTQSFCHYNLALLKVAQILTLAVFPASNTLTLRTVLQLPNISRPLAGIIA